MATFGNRPEDSVTDSKGNVRPGVVITVFATEADAISNRNSIGSKSAGSDGRWPIDLPGKTVVWAREPNGSVWSVASDTALSDHETRLDTVETELPNKLEAADISGKADASRTGAKAVGQGELMVNVADYATPADAMAAVAAGGRVFFPPATYALGGTSLTATVDDIHIDALGATFTLDTWGKPAFDALDVDGWTLDVGLVQYIGARGDHTNVLNGGNSVRGQAVYALGSGFYTNGDRHYIRNLRTIGMPTPVNLSSWDGASATGRYGQSNRIGHLECEGYDFGILWIGQNNLVIEDIYAHDDIDDSSGANPTHAYYCTATSTFRSTGVQIKNARCENNLGGHAFQLKNADQVQLGPHSADNCTGVFNGIDCDDLSWTDMKGKEILAPIAGNGSCIGLATVTNQSKRPSLKNTTLTTAANQDTTSGLVSIQGDDAQIDGLLVVANHSSGVNTGTSDVILRGSRGRLRGCTLKSVGAEHVRGIAVLNTPSAAVGWKIERPTVNGQRSVVDVQAGCTGTGVDYDPAAQTITGGGTAVTGSTADYYIDKAPPFVNVKDRLYGARGDGTTDDTAAITSAINAVGVGGTVYFPATPGTYYKITSAIPLVTGVVYRGAGSAGTEIRATAGSVFAPVGSKHAIVIEGLTLSAVAGHVIDLGTSNGLYQSTIRDCALVARGNAVSIVNGNGSVTWQEVYVENSVLTRQAGATVPGVNLLSTVGGLNGSVWQKLVIYSTNATGTPFFHIEASAASTYVYDNAFRDIVGEQNVGGLIHLFSPQNFVIENVVDWDVTGSYTASIVKIDKGGGGFASRGRVAGVGNRGGTVNGTSVYHVELANSANGPIVMERIGDQLGSCFIKSIAPTYGFARVDGWGMSGQVRTTGANATASDILDGTLVFNGASLTASLPDPATVPYGRRFTIKNVNASALTVVSLGTSKTLDGAASQSLAQWAKATYQTDGTQWLTV